VGNAAAGLNKSVRVELVETHSWQTFIFNPGNHSSSARFPELYQQVEIF
jgi:hypothetical protein